MRLRWLLHPRNLVVYALVAGTALMALRFGWNLYAVGGAIVALLVVHYFVLPAVAVGRVERFDGRMRKLLVSGRHHEALGEYRGRWFLRAFAPPGMMSHRLGQIQLARRAWEPAFQAFHEALRAVRGEDEYAAMLGYVQAGFQVGEDAAILPELNRLVVDERTMAEVLFMHVHVLVADPERRAHARRALERLEQRGGPADEPLVELARAEVAAASGRHDRARRHLAEIDTDALPDTLRSLAPLLEAKLAYVRGRREEAQRSFAGIRGDAVCARAGLELEEFLEDQ